MPTRRRFMLDGLRAGAVCTVLPYAGHFVEARQQKPSAPPDEMTVNSAPHGETTYPPPDFGPLPARLPPETEALRGAASLRQAAREHGLIAGAAVVPGALARDPALATLVADQYGILVPEGSLKWRALRPSAASYDFSEGDALFAFAAKHGMLVRGHTLAWHNSVPDWIRAVPSGSVRAMFVEHISTVMGRYRGRVHSWDVVNEAILPADKQPGALRNSFWYASVGPDYIDLAFRTARAADPAARLTYNDYGVEMDSPEDEERRAAILAFLRGMQERKVPLDAVGIQAHVKAASPYKVREGLRRYISALQGMGLEVYLTEMDVNEDDIASNEVGIRDGIVAETYRNLLQVALENPAVKLVLTWGVSDRGTWLNDGPTHHRKQPNRPQRSLPFDPQYRPVPAFFAIRDTFGRHSLSPANGTAAPLGN